MRLARQSRLPSASSAATAPVSKRRIAARVTASTMSSCSISTSVAVLNVMRPKNSFLTALPLSGIVKLIAVVVAMVGGRIFDLGVVQDHSQNALPANRLHGLLRAGMV